MKQLAIVIPVYKIDFFRRTLDSLASQTCNDFVVYVGDDCSKDDFAPLVQEYSDVLDIHYTRFSCNLGAKDLVAQWSRCIALSQDEPWIWLFSDDDMIEPGCVEDFYRHLSSGIDYDLYHFNVKVIDSYDHVIRESKSFPTVIDSESFYRGKSTACLDSFVVEYIFSREIYERVGGFSHFDLAWNSDVATWIKMGSQKGIYTMGDSFVLWRESALNITPDVSNTLVCRKLNADIEFIAWTNKFFGKEKIGNHNKYALFRLIVFYSHVLDRVQLKTILRNADEQGIIGNTYSRLILIAMPLLRLAKTIKHACMSR